MFEDYTGSYTIIKDFIRNLNKEKQKEAVIRFETNPGFQAQVDWKESLVFKTINGNTIKFNVFLLILGFSRAKFLYVTESKELYTVEECLVRAFRYIGGVPHEILFDNMRSIIDKSRTQFNDPVFDDEFSMFSSDSGFIPKACVASELNNDINNEICKATGKPPIKLLEAERSYLIKTDLNILTGYFEKNIKRRVSRESLISYEGIKYSVPPKYIGNYVDIEDDGTGFNVTFNGHFIRHWDKSAKLTNFITVIIWKLQGAVP